MIAIYSWWRSSEIKWRTKIAARLEGGVEAGCEHSCIAPEPIAPEPVAPEPVAPEPVTLEPVALETSRSQLPFILVYIDVKRIKTFNMKLTQEAMKLKLKLKRGIRCFYTTLSKARVGQID